MVDRWISTAFLDQILHLQYRFSLDSLAHQILVGATFGVLLELIRGAGAKLGSQSGHTEPKHDRDFDTETRGFTGTLARAARQTSIWSRRSFRGGNRPSTPEPRGATAVGGKEPKWRRNNASEIVNRGGST
jgi:hypothetical protein